MALGRKARLDRRASTRGWWALNGLSPKDAEKFSAFARGLTAQPKAGATGVVGRGSGVGAGGERRAGSDHGLIGGGAGSWREAAGGPRSVPPASGTTRDTEALNRWMVAGHPSRGLPGQQDRDRSPLSRGLDNEFESKYFANRFDGVGPELTRRLGQLLQALAHGR